jgi:hypothetical protein
MPLTESQRTQAAGVLCIASDEYVALPLWEFHPHYVLHVLSERKRRNILQNDPEPIGDPEYA